MAYKTYAWNGYLAHIAWAAALMCKYQASYCPQAEQWFNTAYAALSASFGWVCSCSSI